MGGITMGTPEEMIRQLHEDKNRLEERLTTLEENLTMAMEMLHKSMAEKDRMAQELYELRHSGQL